MKEVVYKGTKILLEQRESDSGESESSENESSGNEFSENKSSENESSGNEPEIEGEEAVCVVKPSRDLEILRSFFKIVADNQLQIQQAKMTVLSAREIKMLYEHQLHFMRNRVKTGLDIAEHSASLEGTSYVFRLKGQHCIEVLLSAAGDIDPSAASKETLRGRYGRSPADNKFHSSFTYTQALLENEIFDREERTEHLAAGTIEKTCLLTPCRNLSWNFYFNLFTILAQQKFTVLNMKIDQFPKETLEVYSSLCCKDPSELAGQLLVLALQRENCIAKAKGLLKTYPWLSLSKVPDQELALFFRSLFYN